MVAVFLNFWDSCFPSVSVLARLSSSSAFLDLHLLLGLHTLNLHILGFFPCVSKVWTVHYSSESGACIQRQM